MLCIIFLPNQEPAQSGALPRWRKSAEIVSFQTGERKGTASKVPAVKLSSFVLNPGVNMIDNDKWEKALAHSHAATRLKRLQACGAITIVTPDAEDPKNDSTDFSDEAVALQVINAQYDEKWLRNSLPRENRSGVLQAVRDRIEFLEEAKKAVTV